MFDSLYLDTARVGQISNRAAIACDAVGEAAQIDPQRVFDEITRATDYESSFIPCWNGMPGFRRSMLGCLEASDEHRFFMASHSAALVKLATQASFLTSHSVFCTDLIWPRYQAILERGAATWSKRLNIQSARSWLKETSVEEIVERIADAFLASGADAIFLTAVSSDGFQLPVEQIVHRIEREQEMRFVVVDGAQEFANCDHVSSWRAADLYLFSGHKWLGGYHPLSIGVYGKRRSRAFLETTASRMVQNEIIEDPLLRFQESAFAGGSESISNETINLLPIVAAAAAISDLSLHAENNPAQADYLQHNRQAVAEIASNKRWEFINHPSDPRLQNHIASLRNNALQGRCKRQTSQVFRSQGIACSVYDGGSIRLSLPKRELEDREIARIADCLALVSD